MSTLDRATQNFLHLLAHPSTPQEDLNAAATSVLNAAQKSSSAEFIDRALRDFSPAFRLEDGDLATLTAMLCGALVEWGGDATIITTPLIESLQPLLERATHLHDACLSQMPEIEEDEEDDPLEQFAAIKTRLAGQMPEEIAAWDTLQTVWQPAIAILCASGEVRHVARPLRSMAQTIAEYHEGGYWLQYILAVLDNESILAIEPDKNLGMIGQMSGIADNFQLHVLLMDVFPQTGLLRRRRVSRRAIDVARGRGSQQSNDIVKGTWNMYGWQAIKPDLTLPNPHDYASHNFWIWGEGVPDDIPIFEGHRVVLLGEPSYQRTWPSQRLFYNLPAKIDRVRQLSSEEIDNWLHRMSRSAP